MKLLKKLFSPRKLILFSLVFVFSLGIFLKGGTQVRANFMQSVGISSGGNNANTANKNSVWLQFAQSVNSNDTNITSWSGFPLLAMINHVTALIIGYPDQNGNVQPQGSALNTMSGLIATMYNEKPSSANLYLANIAQNIGFGNSVYAQGPPGTSLFPSEILIMWQGVRNVAYLFMVVIMVAIGFMIMFRFKLDPQTVASVQDSIPKIAVSLILITLSYAIVGLMVDFAFFGNEFMRYFINSTLGIGGIPVGLPDPANGAVGKDIFFLLNGKMFGNVNIFGQLGGGILKLAVGDLSAVIELIVAFSLITTTVKIFFSLLTKYITLLLGAIFIPLVIMWGTLPGQYDTFPKFLRGLASAALAFPMVVLFLTLASYFYNFPGDFNALPPLFPLAQVGALKLIVSLGILMATSNIPQVIDDALEVKASAVGAGVGEAGGMLRKIPIIGSFLG